MQKTPAHWSSLPTTRPVPVMRWSGGDAGHYQFVCSVLLDGQKPGNEPGLVAIRVSRQPTGYVESS
jgi:hypothetical protein